MYEPTEREVDDAVQKSMDIFESAKVGDVAPIEPLTPKKLLVALDGSSQDAMSVAIVAALKERFECAVDLVDAREGAVDDDLAAQSAEALQATVLDKIDDDSYDQILAAIDASQCDLVVVPSPFGRDLDKVGSDSTGTVIDVLLSRSPTPLLVVRQTYQLENAPFDAIVMALIGENGAAPEAARWAAGMASGHGRLDLLLLVEDEVVENVQSLMKALDSSTEITPESVGQALQRSHIRLHRALQQTAESLGLHYQSDVRRESDPRLAELSGGVRHPLLVLAHERADHGSQGHVRDRIRNSPHAVLVVSVD